MSGAVGDCVESGVEYACEVGVSGLLQLADRKVVAVFGGCHAIVSAISHSPLQ